jgi:hypothetical protein
MSRDKRHSERERAPPTRRRSRAAVPGDQVGLLPPRRPPLPPRRPATRRLGGDSRIPQLCPRPHVRLHTQREGGCGTPPRHARRGVLQERPHPGSDPTAAAALGRSLSRRAAAVARILSVVPASEPRLCNTAQQQCDPCLVPLRFAPDGGGAGVGRGRQSGRVLAAGCAARPRTAVKRVRNPAARHPKERKRQRCVLARTDRPWHGRTALTGRWGRAAPRGGRGGAGARRETAVRRRRERSAPARRPAPPKNGCSVDPDEQGHATCLGSAPARLEFGQRLRVFRKIGPGRRGCALQRGRLECGAAESPRSLRVRSDRDGRSLLIPEASGGACVGRIPGSARSECSLGHIQSRPHPET